MFSHLRPVDLLNLSRASKGFRALLMNKGSATYWKASRRNIDGLPECPPFLSEPAFADLCFGSHCHGCCKPCARILLWVFLKRYCSNCKNARVVKKRSLPPDAFVVHMSVGVETSLPVTIHVIREHKCQVEYVHKPDVESRTEEFAQVEPGKQFEWLAYHKQRVRDTMDFAARCEQWQENVAGARVDDNHAKQVTRYNAIMAKLRELGWSDELDKMGSGYSPLRSLHAVSKASLLTEQEWKKIQDEVIEFMERMKASRLAREYREVLFRRFNLFQMALNRWDFGIMVPSWRYIASSTQVRSILNAPINIGLDQNNLHQLRCFVPDVIKQWLVHRNQMLSNCVKLSMASPEGLNPLDLAITSFYYCDGWKHRDRPSLLSFCDACYHKCGSIHMPSSAAEDDHYVDVLYEYSWLDDNSFDDADALEIPLLVIQSVIQACGQDPSTVGTVQMDQLSVRLGCPFGCTGHYVRLVMNWRAAIVHIFSHLFGQRGLLPAYSGSSNYIDPLKREIPPIPLCSQEDAARVSPLDAVSMLRVTHEMEGNMVWFCTHCKYYTWASCTKYKTEMHVKRVHGVNNPAIFVDITFDRGSPLVARPIYIVSDKMPMNELPSHVREALAANEAIIVS